MSPAVTRVLRSLAHAALASLLSPTRPSPTERPSRRGGSRPVPTPSGRGSRPHPTSVGAPGAGEPGAWGTGAGTTRAGVREVGAVEALSHVSYEPDPDGRADPGEVVWTWIPYEEDPAKGKDRPVLVLGRDASTLFVAQLTSQDHDRDAAQEARWGRFWMDIGAGRWDPQGRPSEVRLDRVLAVPAGDVRREGATLPAPTFEAVVHGLRQVAEHVG